MVKKEVGDRPIMNAGKLDIRYLDVESLIDTAHSQTNSSGGDSSPVNEQETEVEDKDSSSAAKSPDATGNDVSSHVGKMINNLSVSPSHHSQIKESGDLNDSNGKR